MGRGLDGIETYERIEVLYWLHELRRDLVRQSPANDGATRGTFSLRSPVRPNPIGTALAMLVKREGATLLVRGLDCLDKTPLVDLKPDRCQFTPLAPSANGRLRDGVRTWRRRKPSSLSTMLVSCEVSDRFIAPGDCEPANGHLRVQFERFHRLAAPFASQLSLPTARPDRREAASRLHIRPAKTKPKTANAKGSFRSTKRNAFRRAWRKSLRSLWTPNQSSRRIVCFQWLNGRFVSLFS